MTKIGILATAQERHGGTLLYTISMIEALSRLPKDQYSCLIFTTKDNHEYDALGLPIARLPNAFRLIVNRILGKDPLGAVDKVIAPVHSSILLLSTRPFAFTLHDLQERHYPENFGWATRLWRYLINRALTACAAKIICESIFVKRDIVRFFSVPVDHVAVVPAPPISMLRDSREGNEALAELRRTLDLPDCYVLYPAQFWPHKNHRRLVDAFALVARAFPECCLVLTGKKRDEYERVFERIRELRLTSRVRHVGYVEKAMLAALYSGATVVVIPTLYESISIPVYEAFSLSAPVCASRVVGLPEQIGDAGLLFEPLSVDDIAAKLCTLLGDPELRRQCVERGRRRITAVTHGSYALCLREIIDAMNMFQEG